VDGSADLTLANLHGDVVTTVPIAATAASGDVAAGVDGWSDFTEYGAPRAGSTTATTGGSVGYGWLGAKQRSTTSETAGLTLMGDRLYNSTTGRFTSLDPEPGGNATAYSYPNDPINMFDLDGHWGISNKWKSRLRNAARAAGRFAYRHADLIAVGVCAFSAGLGCGVATAFAIGVAAHKAYHNCNGCSRGGRIRSAVVAGGTNWLTGKVGGFWRGGRYLRTYRSRHTGSFFKRSFRMARYSTGIRFRSGTGRIMRAHEAGWGGAFAMGNYFGNRGQR
jgi:RHS repeat-associated protein